MNDATTPLGNPEMLRATVPVNPFWGVMVSALVPSAPGCTLSAVGETASENVGAARTVSAIATWLLRAPDVPVIVMLDVPAAAALAALMVAILLPPLTAPKVAVTPVGRPDALNTTVPAKPFSLTIATVLVPLAPAVTLKAEGAAASVKLGG